MSIFFRNPVVKTLLAILCVVSLVAAILSGVSVAALLSSGSYDGEGTLFSRMVQNQLWGDVDWIMNNYFDPQEPTKPWKSYYSGGIYTGEDTNFLYNITDNETGYSVLATVKGGEPICLRQEDVFYFDVESVPVSVEIDPWILEEQVFEVNGTLFGYNENDRYFYPFDEMTSGFISTNVIFPSEVLTTGFSFNEAAVVIQAENHTEVTVSASAPVPYTHYEYDGSGFYPIDDWYEEQVTYEMQTQSFTITYYLLSGLPYEDTYRDIYLFCGLLTSHQNALVGIFICSLVLWIVTLVLLCCSLGWVKGREEPVINLLFKIPTEISLAIGAVGWGVCLALIFDSVYTDYFYYRLILWSFLVAGLALCTVYLITFLAVRRKTRTLVSGSIIHWCVKNARRICRKLLAVCARALRYLPLVWKVGVCYVCICCVELCLMLMDGMGGEILLWFLLKLALGLLVMYAALAMRRLKKGAEAIAAGDYATKVDAKYLVMDFKDTADTLNHIQDGMNAAVESRMKSERLKTELITNVSHDLKTPLTSIVSYVDLLKQEPAGSQAAEEYLEVLDRQSARLKKLIEDLMEASKASTGNIPMTKEPLDFAMVLGQALGEYRERLDDAGLIPVLKLPEEAYLVEADGRLLWRVFDNLLGNIVKYAMPGTRVYLTVETGDTISATFWNISREALAVTADELMERFVRGDSSRHTEGSGLGLSIARSLTESMGGGFHLQVDGDLFKATVAFPIYRPEE